MNKDCLQFIMNNRISGFQHPTRENIMGLFHKVFHSEGGVKEQVAQYFRELNGEQGFLNDNDLMNLRYTLVNDCFYFCEYLLGYNVDKELVYNVSDYYINQISKITNPDDALNFLEELTGAFFELAQKKRLVTYSFRIERSLQYIDQKLYSPITLDEVAAAVSVTPQYLTTLFREETGMTLYQYIRNRKIDEAKMLLLYSDDSITTIASALGFSSNAHFSAAFKSVTGDTPSHFRKKRADMFSISALF